MSFEAIRWAMEQPVKPALTKFVLVAMAECVNAETMEPVCWPSYSHLCARTGMNTKTVEQAVYNLRQEGYIVDTGRRAGGTGKVVVYRLNAPINGGIQPGTSILNANGTRPQNTTGTGGVTPPDPGAVIPPNTAPNPPNSGDQSPQKPPETTPKTGAVTSKGTRKGIRKDPGIGVAAVPGVDEKLLSDWLAVRKDKRAGTLTETAVEGLVREAEKAGLTVPDAVRYCVEANWVGFNAGFYAKRENVTPRGLNGHAPHNRQLAIEEGNLSAAARFAEEDHAHH